MTVILSELAVLSLGFYVAGWRGALAAFVCVAAGHVAGHALALASLRRAGYVVEWRKDGRGVARWRVGVRDAHTAPVAEPVTWFVPKGVDVSS